MKITLAAVTAITGLVVCSTASAAVVKYKATLNGAQEVPAVDTTSAGTAELSFDDGTSTLTGTAEVTLANPADIDNAHIHVAECGKSGSILKGLTINKDAFNGTIVVDAKLDADGAKALAEHRLYLNIHTKANPGGEIRGQIFAEQSPDTCPKTGGTGTDGGSTTTPTDGGGNTSSSGGTTSDAGTSSAAASDDGGCSTSGGSGSNGIVLAAGLAIAVGALARRSKRAEREKQR
jgi:MYXO-CTERM domain-containing protein